MAVSKIAAKPIFRVPDRRFNVWSVDVLDTGRLAVAGLSRKRNNSFSHLFMFDFDTVSPEKPLSLTSGPYRREALTEFGSHWRFVSLLDDRLFLTCCEGKITLYDSSNGDLVKEEQFNDEALCMTTRDGRVYIGLKSSAVIVVLDARELGEKHTIVLKDLATKERPDDITVSSNKLFICTGPGYKRALRYNMKGRKEHVYNAKFRYAESITVSEEKGLTFILWGSFASRKVDVYSLSGGHTSISEDHILASVEVPDHSSRIRINKDINRLFSVTPYGQVYEYHKSDIFTFDTLLKFVGSLTESLTVKNHCRELIEYFDVPAKESKVIIESDAPFETLIHHLRRARTVSVDDISHLMKACSDKELRKLRAVKQLTQLTLDVFKDQLKALEKRTQELSRKLTKSEDENQQLRDELKTLKASPTKPHPPWRISLAYDQSTFQYLSDIFTFDTLLKFVEPLTEKDHCWELIDYFDVPAKESKVIIESDAPFCSLFRYLREEGMVSVDAFSRLMIACSDKGLRKSRAVKQLTQLTLDVFKDQREALEKRKQELSNKLAKSENEKQQLTNDLKDEKEELLQQQQQASPTSDAEGETLLEEHETLDRS